MTIYYLFFILFYHLIELASPVLSVLFLDSTGPSGLFRFNFYQMGNLPARRAPLPTVVTFRGQTSRDRERIWLLFGYARLLG